MTEDFLNELSLSSQKKKRDMNRDMTVVPDQFKQLSELYAKFNEREDGLWITQWPFSVVLYEFILNAKPKKILDLGTGIGCTAAIMALASPESEIHTVDHFEKVSKIAEKAVPKELQKNITFHVSKAKLWYTDYMAYSPLSIYEELPDVEYDFILQDGSGPWREKKKGKQVLIDFPNGDIAKLLIENKLKPGVLIAFDKRWASVRLLERFLGENFYRLEMLSSPEGWLLIQKKTPEDMMKQYKTKLHFEDVEYNGLETKGYFKNE